MLDAEDEVGADVHPWPREPMTQLDVQRDAMNFGRVILAQKKKVFAKIVAYRNVGMYTYSTKKMLSQNCGLQKCRDVGLRDENCGKSFFSRPAKTSKKPVSVQHEPLLTGKKKPILLITLPSTLGSQ
jgi:hypothetical protein